MGLDDRGRHYTEVRAFAPGGWLPAASAAIDPEACVDCGAPIVHGTTRYFQRHDPEARRRHAREHPLLARPLEGITYDPVCGFCGDRALEHRGEADE
jgi:hypothetical protein